ncbi:transposase [Streptomyces sp. 3211]|uniref:transposase n=1 Tax=Streptomyces sp. 3211 TaxID=1964449 RepID=UPI003FA69036
MSGKSGKRYTAEFKKGAVDLVLTTGRTPTEVAGELGVSALGLRSWVKQAKTGPGPGAGRCADQRRMGRAEADPPRAGRGEEGERKRRRPPRPTPAATRSPY